MTYKSCLCVVQSYLVSIFEWPSWCGDTKQRSSFTYMHANISWPRQYVQFTRIRRVYLISLTYVHSYPSGFEATTLIKAYVAWCILVFDSQSIKEEKIMEAEWTTNSHQICLKTLKNDSFDYYLVHKKFKYFRVNFWIFFSFYLDTELFIS